MVDTRTIHNFLSDSELRLIEDTVMAITPSENFNHLPDGTVVKSGHYHVFDYYDPRYQHIKDIMHPRLVKIFGDGLYVEQIHIFDCFDPYNVHSDVASGQLDVNWQTDPAWTFIIPMHDYDSHTIVFEEGSTIKDPYDYVRTVEPYDPPRVTSEQIQRYFSHIPEFVFRYLTIEDIFPWRRGSLFAASRYKFHTSDNFLANGITGKRAMVAWTRLQR